jgi:hypothetical protein
MNKKYNTTPLIRTLVIRIGLALRVNVWRILQKYCALKLPFIGSKQYSVMASRTPHQAYSKGLDAGKYCIQ